MQDKAKAVCRPQRRDEGNMMARNNQHGDGRVGDRGTRAACATPGVSRARARLHARMREMGGVPWCCIEDPAQARGGPGPSTCQAVHNLNVVEEDDTFV